jgi:carbon starvation protein
VAVFACLILAFGASNGQYPGDGGMLIWPIFGASNQILASLTLLVISIFLMKLGRPAKFTLIPMIFIMIVAFWASAWYLISYFNNGQWLLFVLSLAVMSASVVVMLEAWSVIGKLRKGESPEAVSASK